MKALNIILNKTRPLTFFLIFEIKVSIILLEKKKKRLVLIHFEEVQSSQLYQKGILKYPAAWSFGQILASESG